MQFRYRLGAPQRPCAHPRRKPAFTKAEGELVLSEAPCDVPLKIKAIHRGERATARLATLGILPGATVKVIQNDHWGPLLLEVKGAKVALGRGIASWITVTQ